MQADDVDVVELIKCARVGDEGALHTLAVLSNERLQRFLAVVVFSDQLGDPKAVRNDLRQDTMAKFVSLLEKCNSPVAWYAFICEAALNILRQRIRALGAEKRGGRVKSFSGDDPLPKGGEDEGGGDAMTYFDLAVGPSDVVSQVIQSERMRNVRQALTVIRSPNECDFNIKVPQGGKKCLCGNSRTEDRFLEHCRCPKILVLKYFADWTDAEIAFSLRVPPPSLSAIRYKCEKRLKEAYHSVTGEESAG